ncbi:hypothetical protein [Kouleothrix sp.]|uniref:hypothetical protein n=1 Tax=Kouleothrix sp. TaxID=2779161 RepID=UPI00391DC739
MKAGTKEYERVHSWIKQQYGDAAYCIVNKEHKASNYHWANISREYKYEISDWIELCPGCHSNFDKFNMTLTELLYRDRNRLTFQERMERGEVDFTVNSTKNLTGKNSRNKLKRIMLGLQNTPILPPHPQTRKKTWYSRKEKQELIEKRKLFIDNKLEGVEDF